MRKWTWTVVATLLLAGATGALALANDLPKLPGAIALHRSGDSPGQVTFLHASHVGARPDCTQCHPKLFPITQRGGAAADRITHARMEKGQKCGACHNGKKSFAFDDCTMCHK
jgi:c(7)-type cytochrome triheme protein